MSEVKNKVFMSAPPKHGMVGAAGTGNFASKAPSGAIRLKH